MLHRTSFLWLCTMVLWAPAAGAQGTYAISSDLLFYGDNTEFTNPFRSGETLFGVSGRVLLDVTFNDAVRLRGGLFGLGRFGSGRFLEHAEPAVALEFSRGPSRLVFGSLQTSAWAESVEGPDRDTPHGLLPPLQDETLTFSRGQEMGLQWLVAATRFDHDVWINWQRLNTVEARERFDAGYRATLALSPSLTLHGQWHLVHEGGQQFARGAVNDSQAAAAGLAWTRRSGDRHLALDTHVVITQDVPDREQSALTEAGIGTFSRAAVGRGPWRVHAIVWRSRDTLKAEGDANYLARQRDGRLFRKVRDYAELGLTRGFQPAPGVHAFAAFRLHRIESHYEYSYRIAARVHLRRPL
jgi:hypothetical protein